MLGARSSEVGGTQVRFQTQVVPTQNKQTQQQRAIVIKVATLTTAVRLYTGPCHGSGG
jgi:hypothetical protein